MFLNYLMTVLSETQTFMMLHKQRNNPEYLLYEQTTILLLQAEIKIELLCFYSTFTCYVLKKEIWKKNQKTENRSLRWRSTKAQKWFKNMFIFLQYMQSLG